jgi:NCS1 family nucleobase:cation symporter-1
VDDASVKSTLFERLDKLNEFERQPVGEKSLQSGLYFAGAFAGEHVAATEFVIGALFVNFGARAFDVIVGLLVGNLLAVLSWTLVCAPIAVRTRLTLYWYLRKIAGPAVMVIYNVVNALLYCVLGGAMITVAASAVRIPFNIPEQTKWYPEHARFVLVVLVVGAVVVTLAILGFKRLAQFATVCSPWMLLMFVAGGLIMLPQLGTTASLAELWRVADEQIWSGPRADQVNPLGFWHVVAFAWVCNLGMHIGLTDMALFRYARRASYGLYSACGMYLGHYVAWICAGVMGAAAAEVLMRPLPTLDSGSVAYTSLGAVGVLAVVVAGWTTANPMLYRAGLALQVITPGWPRWKVTLIAGVITTIVACSPFVFTKMLDFVVVYGLILMPMGTVVVMEHWVFPRLGLHQFWASRRRLVWNWPALVAWIGSLVLVAILAWVGLVDLYFLFLPAWCLAAIIYLVLAAVSGARGPMPAGDEGAPATGRGATEETSLSQTADTPADASRPAAPDGKSRLFYLSGAVALVGLALCLILPLWIWLSGPAGYEDRVALFRALIFWITLVYFVSGTIWLSQWERRR